MCVDVIDKDPSKRSERKEVYKTRVAVAGLGLIGEGAALRVIADDRYDLCGALVNDVSKPRGGALADIPVTDSVDTLIDACPDVIIDALPVGDTGRDLIAKAVARGVSIVSANKQAVAGSLETFSKSAAKTGAQFRYAASVGGGAPMVETVRQARGHGDIVEMSAILNGTVNYILTALGDGVAFEDAVRNAQQAGFAEPDPTADLSGDDARAKISILCFEAFGAEIDLDAISTIALDAALANNIINDGGLYRQVSSIKRSSDGAVTAGLAFEKLSADHFFATVRDEGNALRVVTADGRVFECADKGAGRAPTVDSLFADLDLVSAALPPRQKT